MARKQYYEVLEKTQKSSLDVTCWLEWFLNCLLNAIKESETMAVDAAPPMPLKHEMADQPGLHIQTR